MFSYYYFFCMVHGDRSKGSTFLELAEGGGNQEAKDLLLYDIEEPTFTRERKG